MRILLELDSRDYDPTLPVSKREAVRGIIVQGDKLLMIHSRRYDEYKFPGGGLHYREDLIEGLAREVLEETGRVVIPESVKEYGVAVERRLERDKVSIFEHLSYYYFCQVEDTVLPTNLDAYEEEFGYEAQMLPAKDALEHNRLLDPFGQPKWVARESHVLELLIQERLV